MEKEKDFTISIKWSTQDVLSVRKDLTSEQANAVLREVKRTHDAENGVNWGVITTIASLLYPERR